VPWTAWPEHGSCAGRIFLTVSERYTHGHPDAVLRSHRWRTVENSAAYLAPLLSPGTTVLDVGCGPGTITADIAARVAPGAVVGIDASADVIAAAGRDHGAGNLSFRVADVYALDATDRSFDVVHAHQVLQHLVDPVRALEEMRRVCRPGGTVAARDADYEAMTWWPDVPGIARWLDLYRSVARANGGQPDAGRRLVAWAHAAGFDAVTASASSWCFSTREDRAWWAETWADRTTGSPLGDRAVELGLSSRTELRACADAWRAWAADDDGWFVVVHGEILARSRTAVDGTVEHGQRSQADSRRTAEPDAPE
jgi:SAM-dependent methyltransferase